MRAKNPLKFILCGLAIFILLIFNSCSKSSSSTSAGKTISFTATGTPANNSVYLEKISSNNDEITLAIKVKGGTDVYGAVVEIKYDGAKIRYQSSAKGDYLGRLESTLFNSFLVNGQDGWLHIGIDKKGNVSGANGNGTLATIVLKAIIEQINTEISFDTSISNLMPASSNVPIPSTVWFGGSLSYQ